MGHFSIRSKNPGSAPDSNWPHQLLTLCAGPVSDGIEIELYKRNTPPSRVAFRK